MICKEVVCKYTVGSLRWCICGQHDGTLIYERSWISSYTMRIMLNFKTWAIVLAILWCTQVVLLFMTSKCSIEVDPLFESCIEHVFYKLVMPMLTNIFGAKRCSLQPRSGFQPTPCTAFFRLTQCTTFLIKKVLYYIPFLGRIFELWAVTGYLHGNLIGPTFFFRDASHIQLPMGLSPRALSPLFQIKQWGPLF